MAECLHAEYSVTHWISSICLACLYSYKQDEKCPKDGKYVVLSQLYAFRCQFCLICMVQMQWVGVVGSPGEYLIFIWHLWHCDWNPANVIITLKMKLNINQYCRDQRYMPPLHFYKPAGLLPNVPQALCISQLSIEAFLVEFFTAQLFTQSSRWFIFSSSVGSPVARGKRNLLAGCPL